VTRPLTAEQVARAFHDACLAELDALKPGNVHRFSVDDVGMNVADFETSARVAAPALAAPGHSVGARIRRSVEATINAVGHNTNLGIVLLSAPLASAALGSTGGDLRESLAKVLAGLSVADARETYAAIRYAKPGGLGEARAHDVGDDPEVTLLEAMKAHADLRAVGDYKLQVLEACSGLRYLYPLLSLLLVYVVAHGKTIAPAGERDVVVVHHRNHVRLHVVGD
jgi:triphosphoribosyl-dephospho-CoA synthase